ncbi:MAG: DUF1553 domain-containing protein [Victivallaceae bacterium]
MNINYRIAVVWLCLFPAMLSRGYGQGNDLPVKMPDAVSYESFKINNPIDSYVIAQLKANGIPPSATCTDEIFVRRVYLDAIGTLPTPAETRQFLGDQNPRKRAKLIDALLERREFADYQALKWGDLLRIKAEFPSNLWPQAAQGYDRWVRQNLLMNTPYDQFVRQLLTASGSNFHVPPVNFYRAFQERGPRQIAENVALVFMGIRLNSKDFTEEQILGMAAFFAKTGYKNTDEWKEEIVYFNEQGKLLDKKTNLPVKPAPLNGKQMDIPPDKDPRVVFAEWLTAPDNPWFARNAVNRVWGRLTGRGISDVDNMSAPGACRSPELLTYLEKELITNKYDIKHIFRLILNSNTYQLSAKTNSYNAADDSGFSHYRIRRVEAEPLIDAICQITGTSETYSSNIPEPYTFLPNGNRAITLADGSIDSPFLELFGRPPRNTSYESERNNTPSWLQAQHLLNSSHIQRKIDPGPVIKKIITDKKGNPYIVSELYLLILSRFPTEEEKNIALNYMNSPKRKQNDATCDLAWALINSKEFILKH